MILPPATEIIHTQRMNDYLDESIVRLRNEMKVARKKDLEALEVIIKMIKDNKESIKAFQERRCSKNLEAKIAS